MANDSDHLWHIDIIEEGELINHNHDTDIVTTGLIIVATVLIIPNNLGIFL